MLNVICQQDGNLMITVDANTAALLGGRDQFGDVATAQEQLQMHVADAWYAAGCPREQL